MSWMPFLKQAAYRCGALDAAFRARRGNALTVAMFHRVLPVGSPCWRDADPTYTLSDELFGACTAFFARHYSVVGIKAILGALDGQAALPARPLLITFDDGWADNAACAAPILAAAGLPAVVFVVPDAVRDPAEWWWQEALTTAARHGRLTPGIVEALWRLGGGDPPPSGPADADFLFGLFRRLASVDPAARQAALQPLTPPLETRQMLTEAEVRGLAAGGIAVGAHGATHMPLTLAPDAGAELRRARQDLAGITGAPGGEGPTALSFPHGRYSPEIVRAAREAGYRAIFTSDACLNPLSHGRPCTDVLGRISVEASAITDARGRFHPELLLLWLASRPVRALGGPPPV